MRRYFIQQKWLKAQKEEVQEGDKRVLVPLGNVRGLPSLG